MHVKENVDKGGIKMGITRREFIKISAGGLAGFLALETLQSCGVEVVPSFLDIHSGYPLGFTEEFKPTTCWIGKQDCGMLARVVTQKVNGKEIKRIIRFEGHPNHPLNKGTLCPKGNAQLMAIYDYNRVKTPLKRTNAKGEQGTFVPITWEEAIQTVGNKIIEAKPENEDIPILWQKGRSKAKGFYDKAFVNALKNAGGISTTKMGHGAYCSDAGYRAAEYTIGLHGVINPDFKNTNYLLSWGWNLTNAGGNKYCWLTWPQQFVEARERGMKVVALDPFKRSMGPHVDEWLPIKPGTDLAFFLGLANHLLANDYLDGEYLKNYTNAPFLVRDSDGAFARDPVKELVWDTISGEAVPYDTPGIDPALSGSYNDTVYGNGNVRPALERFKDSISANTPEWADTTCGLNVSTTERIAEELYENAKIGETITIDGSEMPYRPASLMAYHVAQQELGFQAVRAAIMVFMLLGAIDVPGGMLIDLAPGELNSNYTDLDTVAIADPPYDFTLKDSKFFPINSVLPSFVARTMLVPETYEVDPDTIPKIMILHMTNPVVSFPDTPKIKEAYSKMDFVVVIDPWLSETADLFADIILPAATIEKYEGPMSSKTPY